MGSVNDCLSTAATALNVQSKALSSVSTNIANSSTTGYKSTSTDFASLLCGTDSTTDEAGGGVTATITRNTSLAGDIAESDTETNLAVSGDGFFVVSDDTTAGGTYYTRDGSFSTDADGNLVNDEGYYLQARAISSDGTVDTSTLSTVNVSNVTGSPTATTSASIAANLPSEATVGTSFTSDLSLFDSEGGSNSVTLTWTKTGENTWSVDAADPVSSTDASTTTGTISGFPKTVTFNSDGTLASVDGSTETTSFEVSGWTDGAEDQTVALNLGTAGETDGLSQYASGEETASMYIESVTTDGATGGSLVSTAIGSDGIVTATFSDGSSRAIYQIPLATFNNADGLYSADGTTFEVSEESGAALVSSTSTEGAGEIESSALESSNVDVTDQFTLLIQTQQAYTAASKLVTASDEMLQTVRDMKS